MKVELERSFPLPAPSAVSWAFLQNIEAVAGCMPGARITERTDDRHYKGTVAVRVGPASMSFKGDIEVLEIDTSRCLLRLVGKGSDSSGTSGASMDLTARIEAGADDPGTSTLNGRSEVTMSGKGAAFGGRMMTTVADQILKDFAANFARAVQAQAATQSPAPASKPDTSGPASASTPTGDVRASEPAPSTDATPPATAARELNALGLLWSILRNAVHNLFHRKPRPDTRTP